MQTPIRGRLVAYVMDQPPSELLPGNYRERGLRRRLTLPQSEGQETPCERAERGHGVHGTALFYGRNGRI